jgi:glycosyltransferase involved in cell wall biosynthesis
MNRELSPPGKKSIAIVTSIHPDYDKRIWRHATCLAREGYVIHLVSPWPPLPEKISNIHFHSFPRVSGLLNRVFRIPFLVTKRLWPVLSSVSIVHFHDIDLLPLMSVISRVRPVVYDVHENFGDEVMRRAPLPLAIRRWLGTGLMWLQFIFSLRVKNVVLVTPHQEDDFSDPRFNKLHVRNYPSSKLLRDVTSDYATRPDTVVFIGAQHENNGSLLLVDIAKVLKPRYPALRFIIPDLFSKPRFKDRFLHELRKEDLVKTVQIVPKVRSDRIMTILNRGTIGISPNLRVQQQIKGIHTKIFEYMAAGLPVVASDLPHQVQVIQEAEAGLLAQPESADSFAQAIATLIEDKTLAMRLGAKGQRAIQERYSFESQVALLTKYYDRILLSS